jgi:hypothetical protein
MDWPIPIQRAEMGIAPRRKRGDANQATGRMSGYYLGKDEKLDSCYPGRSFCVSLFQCNFPRGYR